MRALHLHQPGKLRLDRQPPAVARRDAADGGVDEHIRDFRPQPAGREVVDRLFAGRRPGGERLAEQAQLAAPRQRRRGDQRGRAVGHLAQSAVAHDVATFGVGPRLDQPRRQSQPLDEGQRLRLAVEEAVGPGLDHEAVHARRLDVAADPRCRLEDPQRQGDPGAGGVVGQRDRGGEAGRSRAHHDDPRRAHTVRLKTGDAAPVRARR